MPDKYYQTVGRRKRATAQVRLFPNGSGKITVNNNEFDAYFKTGRRRNEVIAPLVAVGKRDDMDVTVRVVGGGMTGQAEAVKLGIARALVAYDETFKPTVKSHGHLTRDARKKERKKFGKHGARRSPQWRKR